MNAKRAKQLRKMARDEMSMDRVPDRDLVIKRNGVVVNSPSSVRAMYLQLKGALSDAMRNPNPQPVMRHEH